MDIVKWNANTLSLNKVPIYLIKFFKNAYIKQQTKRFRTTIKMKYLSVLVLFLLSSCNISRSTPIKDDPPTNNFAFPYRRNHTQLKIVGGQEARPHQFPYEAGLYITRQLEIVFCGGSLISNNYILTAAHCAIGAISIEVVLGAHSINDKSESSQLHQTTTAYLVHPDWDSNKLTSDLALIKLGTPITESQYIKIVKVASGNNPYTGQIGTVTGWGKTYDTQTSVTPRLMYVSNPILSNADCKAVSSQYDAVIQRSHLCLSGVGGKAICQGDSGGPLVSDGYQVGVVSFGPTVCQTTNPSVFTRLTEFTNWIKDNSDAKF